MRSPRSPGGEQEGGGGVPVRMLDRASCRLQGSFGLGFADSAKSGAARAGFEPDHAEPGGQGKPTPKCPSIGAKPRPWDPAPSVLPWQAAREAFARSIAATYSSQGWSQREKSLTLLSALAAASAASRPRLKRSADREPFPSLWIHSVAQSSWGEKRPQGGGEDRQKVEIAHKGTGEMGEMWEMFLPHVRGSGGGTALWDLCSSRGCAVPESF